MKTLVPSLALILLTAVFPAHADDFSARCADRTAVEQVYHAHRLGTKLSFEEAMPDSSIARLVREDELKETVLRKIYGVAITPAMLAAEVQRIRTTTQAPAMLAEIQHALADDTDRFIRSMVRPILVERELRRRFDNDDSLHAAQRRLAEQARARLMAGESVENLRDATWQLAPRPTECIPASSVALPTPTPANASSSAYTVEATAQLSQVFAETGTEKFYFDDLAPELQNVLRAQLQKTGDVSAVIETPGGFLLFVAKGKTSATLSVASLSIPKRSYEEWGAQQAKDSP